MILGIRLSDLPAAGTCLKHEDVEPITLLPVKQSNGEIVYQQLEESIEKTGIPREVIADHGSDVRVGIEKFCQKHPETCSVYDIKHKTAALLKEEIGEEEFMVRVYQIGCPDQEKGSANLISSFSSLKSKDEIPVHEYR